MKIKDKIYTFIYKIVADALWHVTEEIKDQQLNLSADTARLIIDVKNKKLSFKSRDYLMRMNINPDEFNK